MSQSSSNSIDEVNASHKDDISTTSLVYPISILDRINNSNLDNDERIWSDRIALQNSWTLHEKGWQVSVEWKVSPLLNDSSGIGVFAKQLIPAGTILRIGILNDNLIQLTSINDIETFCNEYGPSQYQGRLQYVQDYLWGFYPSNMTDENGYPKSNDDISNNTDERFFGMWMPGNGLNHNKIPNTVYRNDDTFTTIASSNGKRALYLIALSDIQEGDELFDDYRRHGTTPPLWLKNYAIEKNITLNFADCNDFVM
jgi:hypothetical protein